MKRMTSVIAHIISGFYRAADSSDFKPLAYGLPPDKKTDISLLSKQANLTVKKFDGGQLAAAVLCHPLFEIRQLGLDFENLGS